MTSYKLTYFDIDGGRAEPIRIAFHAAGIEFEDKRLSFPEFGEARQSFLFNAVPVLEIDGATVTQSNALSRYIGKKAGLYPTDDLQALYCDEVMGAVEDMSLFIVQPFLLEGEDYFASNSLTIADLKVFGQTGGLWAGQLDHIPTDLVQRLAPNLIEHQKRVAADPRVAAYYSSRS
ncbi:MAG: glutathione S-transferase family protein [Alphaproteobacteria bacterium]